MRLCRGEPRLSWQAVAIFTVALGAVLLAPLDADARSRRHHHRHHASHHSQTATSGWHSGQASIVVDAKTGKVLEEKNADKLLHPASLTKIMTLYLLFEQIEAGRYRLDSKLNVSQHASEAAPSKLGLDAGDKIEVEDAIKAIVTRSANDVAVTIGENIGGSEEAFATLMTRKARALGMTHTVFRNASGLPDKEMVTTARDLALLGRAVQDRFPRLYRFFSIKAFHWHGKTIPNHNHLISRDGVDGIKTGYTRASGFNLVTSIKLRNRALVAVVLGGRSARSRDQRMRALLDEYLPRAYAGERKVPLVAEAPRAPVRVAKAPTPTPAPRVAAATAPVPIPGSRDRIRPKPVHTVAFRKNSEMQVAEVPSSGTLGTLTISPFGEVTAGPPQSLQITSYAEVNSSLAPQPLALPAPKAALAAAPQPEAAPAPAVEAEAKVKPEIEPAAVAAANAEPAKQNEQTLAGQPVAVASLGPIALPSRKARNDLPLSPSQSQPQSQPERVATVALARPVHAGWQIQIGAFSGEQEAVSRLQAARAKLSGVLAKAQSYTEKTIKGSVEYVRARFAGFHDEADAKKACAALKKNDFACIPVRN